MTTIIHVRVRDLVRAQNFYAGLLGANRNVGLKFCERGESGAQVLLESARTLDEVLDFVWDHGGAIVSHALARDRAHAVIVDCEGNRVEVIASVGGRNAQKISLTPIDGNSGSVSNGPTGSRQPDVEPLVCC